MPRALHRHSSLDYLITDTWVRPDSLLAMWKRNLRERFHPGLADVTVCASNRSALAFEAQARLRGLAGWKLMIERNKWFQRRVITQLARHQRLTNRRTVTLFAYSYAAQRLGVRTRTGLADMLGQIDPGPLEERIVARLYQENRVHRGDWQPAPPVYWENWRKECALADRILVNSSWSRDALMEEGVAAEKISVVPLAFEAGPEVESFERRYPAAFTTERPLRVLFLGQINLRKGVGPLLDAARLLRWRAGGILVCRSRPNRGTTELKQEARIRWTGVVSRGEVARYYREADVFVFPTFSDGFGLTQLEAQAWKLPLVASRFCGRCSARRY